MEFGISHFRRDNCMHDAFTLQGMARVRSGQAPA